MIELTLEQRQAVAQEKKSLPRVLDPETKTMYVLVREEIYERMKGLLSADGEANFPGDLYPMVMEVFGRDGWDDPAMDVYNDLDPRRKP